MSHHAANLSIRFDHRGLLPFLGDEDNNFIIGATAVWVSAYTLSRDDKFVSSNVCNYIFSTPSPDMSIVLLAITITRYAEI